MKQHIAKLLVFLMLMTTMIVPADLSFAESGNENTTQTEEPSVPPENQQTTTETKAAQQSTKDKKDIAAAEEQQLEETVTERMEFLYIESKELAAPGTQNIVVSWKEAIDDIQNMVLVYENEQGKTFTLKESKRNDESIVFTKDFTASEAGTYKIKGVQYFVGNEEKYFAFDDVEIAASFKVVKGQTIEDDAIAKVEVESNGAVDKKEINAEIKDAVTSTDAAPKAQTKARSTKSSNIVVVLDPGHGGKDSGATRGSVYEKTINFKVASYCKAELEKYYGVTVYMTRTGDTNPSLEARARFAASKNADILVSIHQNSGSSSSRGAEVYYPNKNYKPAIGNSGKAVANSIQKELVSLGLNNRGTKIRNTANGSIYADGSYADYYGIIRNAKKLGVPGIIVEHAFLSNTQDYNTFLNSDSKLKKLGVADATGIAKAFGLTTGQWVLQDDVWKFAYADGTYALNKWIKTSGKWYYVDGSGEMVRGLYDVENNKYYFNNNGAMCTGWQKIEGTWYYFNANGAGKKGWLKLGKKRYYLNKDCKMLTGLQTINNQKYYLNSSGVMCTGWQKVNGTWYYFDANGAGKKGWLKQGKSWYYLDKDYKMLTGLQTINNQKYYLNVRGTMCTGWQKIEGTWYYFNANGVGKKGWLKLGKKWYYLNKDCKMLTGIQTINNQKYYLNGSGAMCTGWQKIEGTWYYFNASGVAVVGWLKLGRTWYYMDQDCRMLTGLQSIDGKSYYFNSSGAWVQGYPISGNSSVSVGQLVKYYNKHATYPSYYKNNNSDAVTIKQFCEIYYEEAKAENIRVEVAFCQAMKETGWLKYGGDVKIGQYNFAGLGATGDGKTGASFKTVRLGIRAQIQHLKAYANVSPLNKNCVDPRFNLVQRGSAPYVEWLGIKANPYGKGWAPAASYGTDIVKMIADL